MRRDLLISILLACFIVLAGVCWVLGSRATTAQIAAQRERDSLYGYVLPCGHRYQGERTTINGLRYLLCAQGHPWPENMFQLAPATLPLPPPPR